jgi:hypothetical protein
MVFFKVIDPWGGGGIVSDLKGRFSTSGEPPRTHKKPWSGGGDILQIL